MKTLNDMSRDEISLLLFLETRAVDYGGRVNNAHMNTDDMAIARQWHDDGFVEYGRIALEGINQDGASWCHLSDEAWTIAAEARKARADRGWAKRTYTTTAEMRAAATTA